MRRKGDMEAAAVFLYTIQEHRKRKQQKLFKATNRNLS